jgi:hypothetical protein
MLVQLFSEFRRMRLRSLVGPAVALVLVLGPLPGFAVELAAHRALYDLTLKTARGDVIGAIGSMTYEVTDACDAWAVHQRLQMTVTDRDGQDTNLITDYTTWESKNGQHLRFRMRQLTDDAVSSDIAGSADLTMKAGASIGGVVHYSLPDDTTKQLPPGTLFPMAHTARIIAAAKAGEKFVALPLFDGTGTDGAQDTSIVIVGWNPPAANAKWPDLAALPSGRVHIAFFDRTAGTQEPDYEVGMRYWENGIADDLEMDFGDYVMDGHLTQLTVVRPGC